MALAGLLRTFETLLQKMDSTWYLAMNDFLQTTEASTAGALGTIGRLGAGAGRNLPLLQPLTQAMHLNYWATAETVRYICIKRDSQSVSQRGLRA